MEAGVYSRQTRNGKQKGFRSPIESFGFILSAMKWILWLDPFFLLPASTSLSLIPITSLSLTHSLSWKIPSISKSRENKKYHEPLHTHHTG